MLMDTELVHALIAEKSERSRPVLAEEIKAWMILMVGVIAIFMLVEALL